MRIENFCLFQTAHCPPTEDETRHAIQNWAGTTFGKYYTACADGVQLFRVWLSFEGGYDIAYSADGTVLYAAGPRPDISPPVCGDFPQAVDDGTCRTCRVPPPDTSGEGGNGGATGEGGAAGARAAGSAGADPASTPDCSIDATGAVVMPR